MFIEKILGIQVSSIVIAQRSSGNGKNAGRAFIQGGTVAVSFGAWRGHARFCKREHFWCKKHG
jgi:hypothetical protein